LYLAMLWFGCQEPTPEPGPVTDYVVTHHTEPDPLVAGEAGTFTLSVTDQDGRPVEDLQTNHERIVHTILIPKDLSSFSHEHQEDDAPITADDLRSATFRFEWTPSVAGDYLVVFDFAHQNLFWQRTSAITVAGSPAQGAQDLTPVDLGADGDVSGAFAWEEPPAANVEARWTMTLSTADGPVTDLVPWIGADAHCAIADSSVAWAGHTHAWVEGMESMSPSMTMPPAYSGPEVPFRYTFPAAGTYKLWTQFTRAADPERVYTIPVVVEVP
jgi:hypothetical protein